MKEFRLLKPDEIEVRVGHTSRDFSSGMLLLYKDARCDMKILDETVGVTGWQRTHEVINGQLFCNVSIYDEDKMTWIVKQDVGSESFSEAEKGRASDAFKRACFNVGIGRELYTGPQIWVNDLSGKNDKNSWKYKKYRVKDIGYDENRKINQLIIEEYHNYNWQEVFCYPKNGYTSRKNTYKQNFKSSITLNMANDMEINQGEYKGKTLGQLANENLGIIKDWYKQASGDKKEALKLLIADRESKAS